MLDRTVLRIKDFLNTEKQDNPKTDKMGIVALNNNLPPLNSNSMERVHRIAWLVAGIEFAIIILLIITLASLAPLKRIEPMLVTFGEKEQQIVRIEPFQKDASGFGLMTEKLIMEYTKVRNEVVLEEGEMKRRWGNNGYISIYSTDDGYKQFVKNVTGVYESASSANITRSVTVNSIDMFDSSSARVQYQTTDKNNNGDTLNQENWIATVKWQYLPDKVTYQNRYDNPLGFKVISFLAARG